MCLCFPEFSGKYVYDDIMCFIQLFSLLLSGTESKTGSRKKVIHWVIFLGRFYLFFAPPPLKLKPLALIAKAEEKKILYRHLMGKSALKRALKWGRKKPLCCAFVKAEAAAKKYCILFIDPKASRSRTCHDSFRGPIINCP